MLDIVYEYGMFAGYLIERHMSNLHMDVLSTILVGLVGIFVYVGRLLLPKFVINPLYELQKVVSEIRYNLELYASDILTPIGRTKERSDNIREVLTKNSCDLLRRFEEIPCLCVASWLLKCLGQSVPSKEAVSVAARALRTLPFYLYETDEDKVDASQDQIKNRIEQIKVSLGLKYLYET